MPVSEEATGAALADPAVHLETILCSQSHGSAGSQLQQLDCGPEYTTPWVATGTRSL